jgi:hypothetical protein
VLFKGFFDPVQHDCGRATSPQAASNRAVSSSNNTQHQQSLCLDSVATLLTVILQSIYTQQSSEERKKEIEREREDKQHQRVKKNLK